MVPRAVHLQQKALAEFKVPGEPGWTRIKASHWCSMVRHRCASGHCQAAPSSTPPAWLKLAPWGAAGPFLVVEPFLL